MMKTITFLLYFSLIVLLSACSKSDFLDEKPASNLLVPATLNDFQALLDNTNVMNFTGGLAQLASDDYTVTDEAYQSVPVATQRNSYIWAKDLYGGEREIRDWNKLYEQVFYTNAVLDGLARYADAENPQARYLKGWALFARAFSFYDLIRNFCKAYDAATAATDPGIPLRLSPAIDYTQPRATLQQSFGQVLSDLSESETLLPVERPSANLNRPSKLAVYALLARIFLDMGDYSRALDNAEKCLALYDVLLDYNTISKTSATPFSTTNAELIYNAWQVAVYGEFTGNYTAASARIAPDLLGIYSANDLRKAVYFNARPDNSYIKKRGYNGYGAYGFTGLATDEVYLVKAECLARKGERISAMNTLNQLLRKRWSPAATTPAAPYQDLTAATPDEALQKILLERRKELVWRGLRWHDLKRLNREGVGITLTRMVAGTRYTIAPNDPRYVFPIPDDEIALSGITQNIR